MQLSYTTQIPVSSGSGHKGAFFTASPVHHKQTSHRYARQSLTVQNFKFMKKLGLKKPEFLPDFGLDKRKALLATIYTSFDSTTLSPTLADDLKLTGAGKHVQSKQDLITVLEHLKAAVPDFSWNHQTDGGKDEAGFATVTFKGEGKFDGKTFAPPKTPPVEPNGKPVEVDEQTARILVEDGVAKVIEFSASSGGFLDEVYNALGGKIPLGK